MSISQLIPTFNAGELSPYLDARSDIEKYASGCRLLENFIIMPYGGVYRRPGTEYLGRAKRSDKRCRLVPFNFSISTRFVLELGERYVRFWSNGGPVRKTTADDWVAETAYKEGAYVAQDGVVYYALEAHTSADDFTTDLSAARWVRATSGDDVLDLRTPYIESELREVQFLQINDVMYLVHPQHAPQKLSRVADDAWVWQEVVWDWPAVLDENTTATTITPSDKTGNAITLTASKDLFEDGHIGSYWQIGHERAKSSIDVGISANHNSDELTVIGGWSLTTYGNWTASVLVQRSLDKGVTWDTIRSYTSVHDRNVSASGKETKECLLRIAVKNFISSDTNPHAVLEAAEAKDFGIVRITGVDDAQHATAQVLNDLFDDTETAAWSEGAWSVKRGFPRSVSLHEQRIYYGGTAARPQSVWGSVIDDFENFRLGANDDAGLFFTLSAQEANPIQWMTSQDRLLIGTAGEEWTLGSSDQNSAITPSNVQAVRQSSYGSKSLRALVVNEVILFVQRQGRKVRELVYSFEKDGWVAPDLTMLAEHVTRGQIVECAFQQQPDAIYWTITGAGQLVGMTYERDQNVVGWHRHVTQGAFESVATIYGANGADEVWVAVKRTLNGVERRYIERFKVDFRETFEAGDKANWWYLDCARRGAGTAHPTGKLSAEVHDLDWHRLEKHEAVRLRFANTTGVEITLRANGVETVVPANESTTIEGLRHTSDVEWKASSYGTLVFANLQFHYGNAISTTQALDMRLSVTGTLTAGFVTMSNVPLAGGWTLLRARLDAAENKIDKLKLRRDGICTWVFNDAPLTFYYTEGQFADADAQTLAIEPNGFLGDGPLYYDEEGPYDLAGHGGSNTVRTSSGTIKYLAASALTFEYDGDETHVHKGLEHLEGQWVDVLADGAVSPSRRVTGGQIVLPERAETVLAGLPYTSLLRPMKSEMTLPDGATRARKKRVNRVSLSLHQSLGGQVSTNGTDWNWIYSRTFGDAMDASPPLLTGDHEVVVAGASGSSADVTIRQAQPLPLTVLAAVVKYDAYGD